MRRVLGVATVMVVLLIITLAATPVWKPIASRSKWFLVATNIYQDLLRRTSIRHDQIGQSDLQREPKDYPQALAAIDHSFSDYLRYGRLQRQALGGARVLEIGPGQNIGVALRFAAAGAASVTAIDKFVPLQDTEFHRGLYRALRERLNPDEQHAFDEAINLDRGVTLKAPRLRYVHGQGFEQVDTFESDSFDLIVSTAVLEEIYDIDKAFDRIDVLLRPGGYTIHKVDLRDYGMFTKHGFHPLEFLTIPDVAYRRMVESTGQPNRRLIDYYREKMAALRYDATIYTTWVLGGASELVPHKVQLQPGIDYTDATIELISSVRPRLLERYQRLPDADLMVQGIYLVGRKPAIPHEVSSAAMR